MKLYEAIDGGHRITIAKEKGFPKIVKANVFGTGKDGYITVEARDIPVSAIILNVEINPRVAEFDPGTLNKLRKRWDSALIGTISVREQNGSLSDRVANFLFDGLNEQRAVHFFHKFASKVGQHDPDALGILTILHKHGLRLGRDESDGCIRSPHTLWRIYGGDREQKEPELLDSTLAVVIHAWGTTSSALEGQIIDGVARVLRRYGTDIDKNMLSRKLAKSPGGPEYLIGRARGLRELIGGTQVNCLADIIVETYNKALRTNKLPSWRT